MEGVIASSRFRPHCRKTQLQRADPAPGFEKVTRIEAFHGRRGRRMIGHNEIDYTIGKRRPEAFLVSRIPNGWRAFEFRPAAPDGARREKQVMRACFRGNPHTFLFCAPNERDRKLRRKMNDMDSSFEFTREADHHPDCGGFRAWGPRPEPSPVLLRVGLRKSCGFFLDSIREFGMNQQWSIQRGEFRQCGSEIAYVDVRKFRHA